MTAKPSYEELERRVHELEKIESELEISNSLGPATVYGVAKQNNGFINVYSEPDQGTILKIYLPRHAAKAAVETKEPKSQTAERGSETILLVEDEPSILKMTRMSLERFHEEADACAMVVPVCCHDSAHGIR